MVDNKTLVNGEYTDIIKSDDRGLLYGDGLFETLLIQNNSPHLWDAHINRLMSGCERLAIPPPASAKLVEEAWPFGTDLCQVSSIHLLRKETNPEIRWIWNFEIIVKLYIYLFQI